MRVATRLVCALIAACPSLLVSQSLRLPSAERLFVYQGGDTPNVNEGHVVVPPQRWAVDFAVVGGSARRFLVNGDPNRLESYYCFGSTVVAPVTGKVVAGADSLADNPIGMHDLEHPAGNFVVIQSGDHYIYLAHFKHATVLVRAGQQVRVGQPIAQCGNSGNTAFPHIHMHMTGSPKLEEGLGENMYFSHINVELSDKQFTDVEWPMIRGLFVQQKR